MKKAKKILVLSLTAVFLSDIIVPYSDLGAVNASDYPASGNCVFRANEVSVNVSDLRIDGAVCETSDIPEMNSGIMSCLDDETEIASQKNVCGDVCEITNGLYSSSDYCAGASDIIINKVLAAEDSIRLNAETVSSGDNTILYSKSGDCYVNSLTFTFNGIIYAPNGTVYISSCDTEIAGAVIAEKIVIEGSNARLYPTYETTAMLNELEYFRNDRISEPVSFYNSENAKITFMFSEEDQLCEKTVYARYDGGGFGIADETSENTICLDTGDFTDTADYMIIAKDRFGDEIRSRIYSYRKDSDVVSKAVTDSDGDDIPDAYEVMTGTDPYAYDSDGDGFNDGYELLTLYTDPLSADSDSDFDDDGLTNYTEMLMGSNPYLRDSDFDGIWDDNDPFPLEPREGTELTLSEDIRVRTGEFDTVHRFINEKGEKCESVYNWLTDSVRLKSAGSKSVYGIFDAEHRCTAAVTVTPSGSVVEAYTYDGDVLSSVSHNGNRYEYTYDENSNLTGVSINGYELLNNDYSDNLLTSVRSEEAGVEYSYNEDRQIVGIEVDGEKAYEMNYDETGSVTELYDYISNTAYEYSYSVSGNDSVLRAVSASSGFGYEYSGDEDSINVVYNDNGIVKSQNTVISGDVPGRNYRADTALITGNSSVNTVVDGYEHFGQTVNVNDNVILSSDWLNSGYGTENISYQDGRIIDYDYDRNANISAVSINDRTCSSYEYDDMNRLIRENNRAAGKTYSYSYDNYGNILSVTEYDYTEGALGEASDAVLYGYTNSEWNDLLTEYNGQQFVYDMSGKPLLYRDGFILGWGTNRKLESVKSGDDDIAYTYDINGLRTSKTVNGVTTYYNYEDDKLIDLRSENDTIWFIYDDKNSIIGMECSDGTYYFEKNAHADIERVFDSNGSLVCEYFYDAFGNTVSVSGDKRIAKLNPFRYRSYFYDEETGFYNLNARYYDPETRRFINADDAEFIGSKGTAASYNLFAYCENNPVMYSDPGGNIFTFNRYYTISGTFENRPFFSSAIWNGSKKLKANCYCYALNMYASDSIWGTGQYVAVNPGTISGTDFSCMPGDTYGEKIINALKADIQKMSQDIGYINNKYLEAWSWIYSDPAYGSGYDIALVLDLSNGYTDYHWYRMDNHGRWSHKPGNTEIRDVDASGNYIYDPQTADRDYSKSSGLNYSTYVTSLRIYRYSVW